jgi:hypothetical protein
MFLKDEAARVGAEVLRASTDADDRCVVLAERKGAVQPYVTWRYGEVCGFILGHYFKDFEAAMDDFEERCK